MGGDDLMEFLINAGLVVCSILFIYTLVIFIITNKFVSKLPNSIRGDYSELIKLSKILIILCFILLILTFIVKISVFKVLSMIALCLVSSYALSELSVLKKYI